MEKISRTDLATRIADALLECTDSRDLARFYWDAQYEWATDISDEELLETARDLQVLDESEELDDDDAIVLCTDCRTPIAKGEASITTAGRIVCSTCAESTI